MALADIRFQCEIKKTNNNENNENNEKLLEEKRMRPHRCWWWLFPLIIIFYLNLWDWNGMTLFLGRGSPNRLSLFFWLIFYVLAVIWKVEFVDWLSSKELYHFFSFEIQFDTASLVFYQRYPQDCHYFQEPLEGYRTKALLSVVLESFYW